MSYAMDVAADRRLCLLRALEASAGYTASLSLLRAFLASVGHDVPADAVRTELAWLAEQGLAAVPSASGGNVARITERGLDVARGTAVVPGVRRPAPGE